VPTRLVREGWIDSEKIDQLSHAEEVFYLRLVLKADDYGRFSANPKLLKSSLFPLKDGVRDADMTRQLAACEKAGLVRCYEVASKRYIEIVNFGQRVRSSVSKFPSPEMAKKQGGGHMTVICQADARHMTDNCPSSASTCPPYSYSYSETNSETETNANLCPEPASQASGLDEVILVFPCKGTGPPEWKLHASKVAEWESSFPAVSVLEECRKALQWLKDNPARQKTHTGMLKFLNGWLSRRQDSGTSKQPGLFGGGNPKPHGSPGRYRQEGASSHEAKLREQGLLDD